MYNLITLGTTITLRPLVSSLLLLRLIMHRTRFLVTTNGALVITH